MWDFLLFLKRYDNVLLYLYFSFTTMYIKRHKSFKRSLMVLMVLVLSGSFFAYATTNSTISSIAQDIISQIRENAEEYARWWNDPKIYYTLVKKDFLNLMWEVNSGIDTLMTGNPSVGGNTETVESPPNTNTACSWQYHPVAWPVWSLDINPNTTSCTSSLNGKSAYEISWNKQKVATCSCAGSTSPQYNNWKVYISNTSWNDLSKLNWTAFLDKQLYVILDGVDKSNPPKWCAKLAWTAWCDSPSWFRDYLPNEWVSNTRIVSEWANWIAPNTFPTWDYEFYSLYWTAITKIWNVKLMASPSSCSWQYHPVAWPVWSLDINPNTTSCTSSLNGKSAYEISWNKQKVATCSCT